MAGIDLSQLLIEFAKDRTISSAAVSLVAPNTTAATTTWAITILIAFIRDYIINMVIEPICVQEFHYMYILAPFCVRLTSPPMLYPMKLDTAGRQSL